MSFLGRIILYIFANSLAIAIANWLVPGFVFHGNTTELILTGTALGLVNFFVRPVLKILAFPLILITLGLFTVVINIFLLLLVAHFFPALTISGFWAAFWGVIIISITNHVILSASKRFSEDN